MHATELRHRIIAVFDEDFLVQLLGAGEANGGIE